MLRLARTLLRIVSKCWNQLFNLPCCIPLNVSGDERILRAIYSPFHVDKNNRLKTGAYNPTPKTDELSIMRFEYLGTRLCKRKARSFENPKHKKEYRGFAVLRVSRVRNAEMEVVDSRRHYCGHGDIKLLMEQLRGREPHEPLPPEVGKQLEDLKRRLLTASKYVQDPDPQHTHWRGAKLDPPV